MKMFRACLLLICAASSTGCGVTGSVNDGAGYSRIVVTPATRSYLITNDEATAKQIVAHNAQCARDKLCAK